MLFSFGWLSAIQAQEGQSQFNLGIEFSALWDSDWNEGFSALHTRTGAKRMSMAVPITFGIRPEYRFEKWAAFAKLQILNRRMQMIREPHIPTNLVHNTIGLDLGLAYYYPLNPTLRIFFSIAGGMDYVATRWSKLSGTYQTTPEWTLPTGEVISARTARFSIVHPFGFVWSATPRIGVENYLRNWGNLQLWIELHLQIEKSYAYRLDNEFGTTVTGGYRANYGAAGISWLFSFRKK